MLTRPVFCTGSRAANGVHARRVTCGFGVRACNFQRCRNGNLWKRPGFCGERLEPDANVYLMSVMAASCFDVYDVSNLAGKDLCQGGVKMLPVVVPHATLDTVRPSTCPVRLAIQLGINCARLCPHRQAQINWLISRGAPFPVHPPTTESIAC